MKYKEKLVLLLNNSYAPYSKFKVASIVIMNDESEFNGVNVENAVGGAGICAEINAIGSAVSAGYKKGDFKELYLMASKGSTTPCGICRQVMSEFFDEDATIHVFNTTGEYSKYRFGDLFPEPFNAEDLK